MIPYDGVKTATALKTLQELESGFQTWPRQRSALYKKTLQKWGKDMLEFDARRMEPEKVARVVLEALYARNPKRRYSVGHKARLAALLESLP